MQNNSIVDSVFPAATRTIGKSFGISICAALLIALFAHIKIPMIPVPMTMQPFAVMMVGLLFPWRLAVGTVVTYISLAAVGLPVLAGTTTGLVALAGPTSGYIFGYIPTVFFISYLSGLGAKHLFITRFLSVTLGFVILYICGVTVLSRFVGFSTALQTGLYPFILGDLAKTLLACLMAGIISKRFGKR